MVARSRGVHDSKFVPDSISFISGIVFFRFLEPDFDPNSVSFFLPGFVLGGFRFFSGLG